MGNLRSVLRAFQYCGANTEIISKPELVQGHDALVFPGQGAIVDCMKHLSANGFDQLICEWIAADKPFFGICLGLQALFDHSEEGDTPALGIFPGKYAASSFLVTSRFHTWVDHATFADGARLQDELSAIEHHFVHSYYVDQPDDSLNWLRSEYGGQLFTSGISRGNCFATQFHPEKSQEKGLQIYRNFIAEL